ncbi:MAG: peptidoglycan DD-metalloendopeptidase family protein [Lachnospiraceae bacterium]|nr:peptidoglycan DD-metalloendopeptidase family protein [Lachnospiraceae bacterium]
MKKRNLKNFIRIFAISVLVAAFLGQTVMADDIYEAKQRQQEIEEELAASEARLEELRANVASAEQEVAEIDAEIYALQDIINGYQKQSDEKQAEIDDLQKDIDHEQTLIDAEYEAMSKRIKFMYENMGNSYVEVFFTSESFSDAINKIQYLFELNNYDRKQMEKIQEMQDEIKEKQNEVKEEKAAIDELKKGQEDQKAVLDEVLAVKDQLVDEYRNAAKIEEEQNAFINQELAEQKDLVNSLIKEYEAQRKQEIIDNGGTGYVASPGSFLWPLAPPFDQNWITSWYGWRDDPFGGGFTSWHGGLDIGAYCNTPIYAVLDGQVIISSDGWNGGCGNYTVLYHGDGLYTEYMHQNYRAVEVGDIVVQGQVIGYVGTTGSSTGYHLHIGVVKCDWGFDCSCRVDPAPYLGLY